MTCIKDERFVELVEAGGLNAADASERTHFRDCAACRDSWSVVASSDGLLRDLPRPASAASWVPMVVAAAAVLLAVGFGIYKSNQVPSVVTPARQDVDVAKVAKLIAQLDADAIADRTKAQEELLKMGPGIEAHLRRALESGSDEKKSRIRSVLDKAEVYWIGRIVFTHLREENDKWHPVVAILENGVVREIDKGMSPCWSPDGKRIAYVSGKDGNLDIHVMDPDGANKVRITKNGMQDLMPRWSPDGKRIVFATNRDGNYEIYVMAADGSDARRLTVNDLSDHSPDWSPDGRQIVFVSSRDGNDEIYVMDADGRNPSRLTYCQVFDEAPRWSPDGKHIAFMSTRARGEEDGLNTNYFDLYTMNVDGSDPDRLTHESSGKWPGWTPAGTLVYLRHMEVPSPEGKNVIDFGGEILNLLGLGDRPSRALTELNDLSTGTGGEFQYTQKQGFMAVRAEYLYGAPSMAAFK